MKRCRCCRQEWPIEFFAIARKDGWRRATCNACRRGCRPTTRYGKVRLYRAALRAQVEAVRMARA